MRARVSILLLFLFTSVEALAQNSITIAHTKHSFPTQQSVSIGGDGSKQVGTIDIYQNKGSIEIDSLKLKTFIQHVIPWEGKQLTLFQGLAFDEKHFYAYWVYCSPKSEITHIYYESSDGSGMKWEAAKGVCISSKYSSATQIDLPEIQLKKPTPVSGFNIMGKNILLNSKGSGSVVLGKTSQKFEFIPFTTVDCSQCGATKSREDGWYELHSLLWNSSENRACFGIFYLFNNPRTPISLHYSMCFPDLDQSLNSTSFTAQWTSPLIFNSLLFNYSR